MPRLYRNLDDLDHWFVFEDSLGWVRFPARINGWADRAPVASVQAFKLQPVPLWLSFNTGLPTGVRRLHRAA